MTGKLAIILIISFFLISLVFIHTLRQFIGNYASDHSKSIAVHIAYRLNKELEHLESLPEQVALRLLKDYKALHSEYFFITDEKGNYICHPDEQMAKRMNILNFPPQVSPAFLPIAHNIIKGETGSSQFVKNKEKYLIYYTSLPSVNWRLGVCCPYKKICSASRKLYFFCFFSLGAGMLILLTGSSKVVRRLTSPFTQLTDLARQIATGNFNTSVPEEGSCREVSELYTSIRDMQHHLASHTEQLKASLAEKEERTNELKRAAKIQRQLMPAYINTYPHLSVVAELWQSHEIGGDFYEHFLVDELFYFAIGDITGKGIPASLSMISFCQLFRYIAHNYRSTATLCNILNKQMYHCGEESNYLTAFIGMLDTRTGLLKYTNAGHHPPVLIHHQEAAAFMLSNNNSPIGIFPNQHFSEHTYSLAPGSSLLLYTDGCIEAENAEGAQYQKERLLRNIRQSPDKTPERLIPALLASIQAFIGQHPLSDDLTLMQIQYKSLAQEPNNGAAPRQ